MITSMEDLPPASYVSLKVLKDSPDMTIYISAFCR